MLRAYADRVKTIMEETAIANRVRDDWGEESFAVRLKTDSERANTAGLTNTTWRWRRNRRCRATR